MLGNNYKFKIFKVMAFTSKTRVGHFLLGVTFNICFGRYHVYFLFEHLTQKWRAS